MVVLTLLAIPATAQSPWRLPLWKQPLVAARDAQDTASLQKFASQPPPDAGAKAPPAPSEHLRALAYSYLAEVHLELGNKADAASAARQGVTLARSALESRPEDAEIHCLLGTLCGQVIPASPLSALSFGQCALEEVERALRINPRLPEAYLARGVGNYYLPPIFGGSVAKAEADFRKALELAPGWADPHVWMALAARRRGDAAAARKHLLDAQRLAPSRKWIQVQLSKTPE